MKKNHPKNKKSGQKSHKPKGIKPSKPSVEPPVESPAVPAAADSAGVATDKHAAVTEKARQITIDEKACPLQRQLAEFIQRRCEGSSVGAVGKELQVSHTTMFYLLRGRGNIRLRLLEQIVNRLGVGLKDIFPDQ